eukprot:CAMPEP_0118679930 /NCGR_PEP_ID=MMETSP0800-20121206/4065_1 /TAXON_ID=210618 ORGANISM="Striatella unipunctata, Strain CCMP2910" /NCGR_SAMPLE_ID=MMETSP0800 /ASSEMBLY_ACC=CAM_ASM_000638 /LENGTH=57 /DNA_ID=CAMNT_0006575987 /DNA_START=486 /DNA_END=656 /DNA_ORIENTATION=+
MAGTKRFMYLSRRSSKDAAVVADVVVVADVRLVMLVDCVCPDTESLLPLGGLYTTSN